MAAAPQSYQKLPGRGAGLASYSRLYLTADHLLLVNSTGYSESYKRFYFRDVQALVVQRDSFWKVINWICGSLAVLGVVLCVILFFVAQEGEGTLLVAFIFLPISALPLTINLVLGATCRCHIRTAVQFEKLPSINRLRNGRRILGRIKPLIEAAQGTLSQEQLQHGPISGAEPNLAAGVTAAPPIMEMPEQAPALTPEAAPPPSV